MMIKRKKYINLFLLLIIQFVPFSVKANVRHDSNIYNELTNLGFTSDEIKNMDDNEINMNKGLNGVVVSNTVKYLKTDFYLSDNNEVVSETIELTKENYDNTKYFSINNTRGINNGYIETSYKKMTTTIASTNAGYRYKVSLEWKTIPKHRGYDVIGIGISNNVYISSSFTFKQSYCYSNGNCSNSSESVPRETNYGGAALFALPSSNTISSLSSYLYFNISKRNSSNTITNLNAYGDYSHNTKNISLNNANTYDISSNGINISSQFLNYYDEIGVAKATWTGSW